MHKKETEIYRACCILFAFLILGIICVIAVSYLFP